MPRPPPSNLLGLQILFQLIKWSFFSPISWPHQKDLTIESILLQIDLGTLKQEKEYKGGDWRIEEMRVVLPACERSLAFQPYNLELSLSIRNWKSAIRFPLNLKLIPRYLLGCWTRFTFKLLAMDIWHSLAMFREQKRSDLAKFIFWPEIKQYQFRMDWILPREFPSFLKNRRESSAKKRWVKEKPLLPTFTPLILLEYSACGKE